MLQSHAHSLMGLLQPAVFEKLRLEVNQHSWHSVI